MSDPEKNEMPQSPELPSSAPEQPKVLNDTKSIGKELRVSSTLQGLLDDHKAQSLIVDSLKEELNHLETNPLLYFQNRKRFLYHAYTQTLKESQSQLKFDVMVCSTDV